MKKSFVTTALGILCLTTAFAQGNPNLISVDSFAAKINRQQAPQIIDVRTPEEFTINHISGASYLNLKDANHLDSLKNLDKSKPVFIYAIQNSRPDILAQELLANGYKEVYELKGGIAAWIGGGNAYYTSVKNNLSVADYNKTLNDNKIVLVEIGTKYCGLCAKAKVIVDSLQNDGSYKLLQLELYNNPQLVAQLGEVPSVPTILLYKDGQIVWKRSGLTFDKNDINTAIAKAK
ncbi:MAG TPA: rhodanese-like domain-containing protein [Ferruginibacter sp.]|nr:rhodanese-like domain-containing protein [Ferruginibacter sp.]